MYILRQMGIFIINNIRIFETYLASVSMLCKLTERVFASKQKLAMTAK